MEIERKFLVKELPKDLKLYPKREISQGYISDIDPTIRIRKSNENYFLTIKSVANIEKDKQHLMNNEIELEISKEKFDKLSTKIDGFFMEKTRYLIDLGVWIAELDVYKNDLAPLVTVEVEFSNEALALDFTPPYWFGEEVTSDIKYKNFHLVKYGLPK